MKGKPRRDSGPPLSTIDRAVDCSLVPMRLSEARKRSGITQAKLGEIVHKSKNCISQYERGSRKPDPSTLCAYAIVCGISTDYLLGLISEPLPLSRGDSPPTGSAVFTMHGDSMAPLHIRHGDRLTLSATRVPRAGDLVLARHRGMEAIMLCLEYDGLLFYCADVRLFQLIPAEDTEILAMVTGVVFAHSEARPGNVNSEPCP